MTNGRIGRLCYSGDGYMMRPKGRGESLSLLAVRVNTSLIAYNPSSIHLVLSYLTASLVLMVLYVPMQLVPEYFFPYKICCYPIIQFVKGFSVIFPFSFNFFCLYQIYSVISLGTPTLSLSFLLMSLISSFYILFVHILG